MKWFLSDACKNKTHCIACRNDRAWRESLKKAGLVNVVEFDCPFGIGAETSSAIQSQAISNAQGNDVLAASDTKKDIEDRGRKAWLWLHLEAERGALTEGRITNEFEPMIPNYGCQCKAKWKIIRVHNILDVDQPAWAIRVHNLVNMELGKPIWPQTPAA